MAYTSVPGEGAQLPFLEGARSQSVYAASELATAMPNGAVINGISIRLDETVLRDVSGTIPEMEVRMSTTPSLSPVISLEFAKNIGSDYRTVFGPGRVDYTTSSEGSSTKPFEISIPFTSPFSYDPRKGGLLVDIFVPQPATTRLFVDAGGNFGLFGGIGSVRGGFVSPVVMQLSFSAVPEPSGSLLIFTGMFIFCINRRLRA